MIGEAVHDIALRNDPVDGFAILADDKGADIAGNELLHSGADRLIRPDRRHRTSLRAQNGLDVHHRPRMIGAVARATAKRNQLRTKCRIGE